MILYIHGFGSSGFGGKASLMRKKVGDSVLAPSLSPIPKLALDTLEQIIQLALKHKEKVGLIGSSLGGYYAAYLADKYNLKAVLINPSIRPYNTLAKYIGLNHSYFDFSNYEFTQKHINALKDYEVINPKVENFMLLLQTGDTVLDYKQAEQKFLGANIIIKEGGSHSYDGFENKVDLIKEFLSLY